MNDTELDAYMIGLDERLKAKGVAIHRRPFLALSEAALDLKQSIMFDDPIAERIRNWFTQQYGERLKGQLTLGRGVVLIMGDAYAVELPVSYGKSDVDPMDWVDGLTSTMLIRLGNAGADAVRLQILQLRRGYNLKSFLPTDANSWSDVDNAVQSIIGQSPNYGISRYSSSQATEKALKGFIRAHGGKPPTGGPAGHDLEGLRQMAERLDIPRLAQHRIEILARLIAPILCTPGVRYREDTSTVEQAVAAHHASVEFCAFLVSHANFISHV
jgi:HEPN domain-containing protein